MIAILILAFAALAFLFFLVYQVWQRYTRTREAGQLTHVDLEAFENLTDPEEEKFLRTNLAPAEFRLVQRIRIRAAKLYVWALSENASVLVAVGQSVRYHPDPQVVSSGQEIAQRAIRLKVWCLLSLIRLNAALVFPTLLSPSGAIASQYLVVSYMAANLPERLAA
jgi:hypothetical protein